MALATLYLRGLSLHRSVSREKGERLESQSGTRVCCLSQPGRRDGVYRKYTLIWQMHANAVAALPPCSS